MPRLLASVGFGWTTRILGFIVLGCFVIALLIDMTAFDAHQPGIARAKRRDLLDLPAFTDPSYSLCVAGDFLLYVGLWIPLFYIPSYAQNTLGTSREFAFALVSVANAGSVAGRILPTLLTVHVIDPVALVLVASLSMSILAFAWLGILNVTGFVVFCILSGFFSGLVNTILAPVMSAITPSDDVIGTRLGMAWTFEATGSLIGSPIASTILASQGGDYTGLKAFGGTTILGGTILWGAMALDYRKKRAI